jgi:ferric-dicitrate binding protein FerR (iron transport regulator)
VITTYEGASAWVRFRSPASAILLADTQVVVLDSDSMPNFLLRRGTMVLKDADPVQVTVRGAYVMVKGDPQSGAECEMAALGNDATVSVKQGLAEIHGQGEPVILHAGQSARVEAGPQGGQQVAGKISREIPQGVIQRQGETQELPLKLHAVINWNDLVKTLQAGRAQILLLDGSTLNVGARSEIRILKHDPQAQQTELELTMGTVQANVKKITTPGGKFQLHTKSAVIGTIDTSYVASTDDKGTTTVCGVTGTTLVKSDDPNVKQTVTLTHGQCTKVLKGLAPTAPVLSLALMSSLMGSTGVGLAGGLSTAAIVGIVGGAAAGGAAAAGIVLATAGTTSPTSP